MSALRNLIGYLWKIVVGGLAFVIASTLAAALLTIAGAHSPAMMSGVDPQKSQLFSVACAPLLALSLVPLALGLRGAYRVRWLALAVLVFINTGVNTVIELSIFSTLLKQGGALFMIVMYAAGALALGATVAALFHLRGRAIPMQFQRSALSWAGRILLAIMAFPVIYFMFGAAVAPFVIHHYQAGVAGLVLPGLNVIMPVQVVRSALFLLGSAPVIFWWTGSRRKLVLALGWAHTVTVGLYGLLSAYFLPAVLRVVHSAEIGADSFVYALVLVVLLRPASVQPEPIQPAQRASSTSA